MSWGMSCEADVNFVLDYRTAAPIWQKIPSDHSWGDGVEGDEFNEHVKPLDYRQREDEDNPSGKWYHVSTQPLSPGTKLIPRGGPSPDPDFYDHQEGGYDNRNRQNHVWLAPSAAKAYHWSWAMNAPHIHEVKPGGQPQPWNFSGTNGWVVPHAHVTRQLGPEEVDAMRKEFWKTSAHRLQVGRENNLGSLPVSLMRLHPGYFADDPDAVPIGSGLRQHLGL